MLGQRLHNFSIMRLLGEGGMSSVYEAEHSLIRRKVAVKVLRSELSVDGVQVQRFFNEARATSAIRHPNIVEVIDVGRLPDGVPYLVMELLEGESLAERLERIGSLDIAQAVEFAYQAASALEAAHALEIIHRDLKPDNLFLVPDARVADHELVKVLDFGIAKLRGEPAAPPFDTLVGAVLGTPPYMSPEQCRGLPEEIDERTDIYALGIILYEMVCARPPFVADGAGELMMLHMTEAPDPPSTVCPDVPLALENVILCALAKRREDRYASMGEFKAALAEVGVELGVMLEPPVSRRTRPPTLGGGGLRSATPVASFESDTTLTAPKIGDTPPAPGRERPVTGAKPRRGAGSGVVPLHASVREPEIDIEEDSAEELPPQLVTEERSSESELTTINVRDTAPLPPLAAEERSLGKTFVMAFVGAGAIAAAGFAAFSASTSLETSHMPVREGRVAPPAEDHATRQARIPDETSASPLPAASREPATDGVQEIPQPIDPASLPAQPSVVSIHPAPLPGVVNAPPYAVAGAAVRAAGSGLLAQPTTEDAPPRAEAAEPAAPVVEPAPPVTRKARAGAHRAANRRNRVRIAAAVTVRDTHAAIPVATPAPPTAATTPASQSKVEPGYLSLDSSPRADVFLGPQRLGSTPLVRVPLPPGKHLLTLRNPELGASSSFSVEILSGKTLSRLVGWERR